MLWQQPRKQKKALNVLSPTNLLLALSLDDQQGRSPGFTLPSLTKSKPYWKGFKIFLRPLEKCRNHSIVFSLALKIIRNTGEHSNYLFATYCSMFYVPSVMTAWKVQCYSVLLVVLVLSLDLVLEQLLPTAMVLPAAQVTGIAVTHSKFSGLRRHLTALHYRHSWISSKPMSNQRDNKIAVDFLKLRD